MFRIGIIGGGKDTAGLLRTLLQERGLTSHVTGRMTPDYSTEFGEEMVLQEPVQADIWIEKILDADGSAPQNNHFDILIVNSLETGGKALQSGGDAAEATRRLCRDTEAVGGAVLVNSDEKELLQILSGHMDQDRLITYGLNNRACVTASSISDSSVQCCIQRALPTASGHTLIQQEFSVPAGQSSGDVHDVLAAATAAMLATQ